MESCTLYCKVKPSGIQHLAERLSVLAVQSDGIDVDAVSRKVTCRTEEGTVNFALQTFTERGDSFSRLVGKTYIYFEDKPSSTGQAQILTHLDQTEAVIGIVADPAFDAINRLESLVLFLSAEFNALIFNGETMLDGAGDVVV